MWSSMAGKARRGCGMSRQGHASSRHGRLGLARPDPDRNGTEWHSMAGKARKRQVRLGQSARGPAGASARGWARHGAEQIGSSRRGRHAAAGSEWRGEAQSGLAGLTRLGQSTRGPAGEAWQAPAGTGKAGMACSRLGMDRCIMVRLGRHGTARHRSEGDAGSWHGRHAEETQ